MGQDRPPLVYRIGQLLGITLAAAAHLQHVQNVISPLA
jgi:hypothetical protein